MSAPQRIHWSLLSTTQRSMHKAREASSHLPSPTLLHCLIPHLKHILHSPKYLHYPSISSMPTSVHSLSLPPFLCRKYVPLLTVLMERSTVDVQPYSHTSNHCTTDNNTHTSKKHNSPGLHVDVIQSHNAQDTFQPIPGLIICAGVTGSVATTHHACAVQVAGL